MSKAQREAFEAGAKWREEREDFRIEEIAILTGLASIEALRRYPDPPLPSNVREIVKDFCEREGFDGLYRLSNNQKDIICHCIIGKPYNGERGEFACGFLVNCRPGVLVDGKIVERKL